MIYFYCWKKFKKTCIFTQKWLDHLLFMTSYLVTIATDHHGTCRKMCARETLWHISSNQVLLPIDCNKIYKINRSYHGGVNSTDNNQSYTYRVLHSILSKELFWAPYILHVNVSKFVPDLINLRCSKFISNSTLTLSKLLRAWMNWFVF